MSEDAHNLPGDSSNQFEVIPLAAEYPATWLAADTKEPKGRVPLPVRKLAVHNILVKNAIILTRDEALNLAAWLSVLADPGGKDFARLVNEIKKT